MHQNLFVGWTPPRLSGEVHWAPHTPWREPRDKEGTHREGRRRDGEKGGKKGQGVLPAILFPHALPALSIWHFSYSYWRTRLFCVLSHYAWYVNTPHARIHFFYFFLDHFYFQILWLIQVFHVGGHHAKRQKRHCACLAVCSISLQESLIVLYQKCCSTDRMWMSCTCNDGTSRKW